MSGTSRDACRELRPSSLGKGRYSRSADGVLAPGNRGGVRTSTVERNSAVVMTAPAGVSDPRLTPAYRPSVTRA